MWLSYKYRLYPNKSQTARLDRALEIHRSLYNDALTERRLAWSMNKKGVTYFDQANQVKAIREFDEDAAWLNFNSISLTLRRLDKSFQAFFRRVQAGQAPGYPRYKGRRWFQSFAVKYGNGVKLRSGRLYLQNIGTLRMFMHRPIPDGAVIKQVTVKRDRVGRWYAIFMIAVDFDPPAQPPDGQIGIDVGLRTFAALSNGELIANPRWFQEGEEKLATLQRRQSRCTRGSRQYRDLARQIARQHERIANRRADFHHKLAEALVRRYGLVAAEDLHVADMIGGFLDKRIHDAGWTQFLAMLAYKAERAGTRAVFVEASETSFTCPLCGAVEEKKLRERVHRCVECGFTADRDVAAAMVILDRALAAS